MGIRLHRRNQVLLGVASMVHKVSGVGDISRRHKGHNSTRSDIKGERRFGIGAGGVLLACLCWIWEYSGLESFAFEEEGGAEEAEEDAMLPRLVIVSPSLPVIEINTK